MADLETKYLGLTLRNPLVVSSCEITSKVTGIRLAVDAGAGAVVLKSLFEEQINAELGGDQGFAGSAFPDEADLYMREMGKAHGPRGYVNLIEDARRAVDVPIIASVNCISTRWWADYARQIEGAGAHALELNIALMPLSLDETAEEIENHLYRIVRDVRAQVNLPLVVKIGPYFTALPRVVRNLADAGVNGIVLFNRFYQLDIDPVSLAPVPGYQYSTSSELHLPLRWVAILSSQVDTDFSVSTGVHTGMDAVKSIVAGAKVVQIASALYRNKIKHLSTILEELDQWLDAQGYASVAAARGRLAKAGKHKPEDLERMQYVKALAGAR
ncbi:MAG: dihydroorotate dehydrogenase-like protein [Spirochaetaceae bacterium]|nr:MAG: dihydroorotate dehydrogenase-like protein [Spirochaetaceae bacterium]